MDESRALTVTAVRAYETAEPVRALWNDADRAWASRAAAEVVGAQGTTDAFLARRASLALERLGERLPALARAVAALPRLVFAGFMGIAEPTADVGTQRAQFATLRRCRDEALAAGLDARELSMGMTADLESAILEGSTEVRLGTALFGERPKGSEERM